MGSTERRRSFGRFSDELRAGFDAEGVLALAEQLRGSITLRRCRGPGIRAWFSKEATSGAVAVTTRRLVVWTGGGKHVDVPHDHPLRAAVQVATDKPDRLRISYDAGAFRPERSGTVEIRLRTPEAGRIADLANHRQPGCS